LRQIQPTGTRTASIDQSLPREGSTAAIGFLCGLLTHGRPGRVWRRRDGRFLGAQL